MDAALGWVEHLRQGGTRPWRAWRASSAEPATDAARWIAGAQQLELLRRLNDAGRPSPHLAERVLTASAPGRGTNDLLLLDALPEAPRWGPPPVDPATIPAAELVRVATGLLADDLVTAPRPELRHRRTRPFAKPYELTGDPWLADGLRERLTLAGRPPGGRGTLAVVVADDLASMLLHVWTARAFDFGGQGLEEWLGSPDVPLRLPPRTEVVRMANEAQERVGPARVRLVLDHRRLPSLLGVRRLPPGGRRPVLSADAVDLARRVAAPLGLLVLPRERAFLLRHALLPRLARHHGAPLALPAAHHARVARRARRMRDAAREAAYPVLGDPERLVPHEPAHGTTPDVDGVLRLAVRLLLERDAEPHSESTAAPRTHPTDHTPTGG